MVEDLHDHCDDSFNAKAMAVLGVNSKADTHDRRDAISPDLAWCANPRETGLLILAMWSQLRALDLETATHELATPCPGGLHNICSVEVTRAAGFEAYMGAGH